MAHKSIGAAASPAATLQGLYYTTALVAVLFHQAALLTGSTTSISGLPQLFCA